MKKPYLFTIALLIVFNFSKAQLTLTRAAQEPAAGDIHSIQDYDSVGVIPKATGANQTWNFSAIVQTTDAAFTSTFLAASSVPAASLFPGATLAEYDGFGDYQFFKSANTPTTQFENLGIAYGGTVVSGLTYTNTLVNMVWPLAPGNSFTDTYYTNEFGIVGYTTTQNGSQTVTSTGSGTITMPGGAVYANVIQIKTLQKVISSFSINPSTAITFTDTYTIYDYYHSSQKFPLLTVNYDNYKDANSSNLYCYITVNKLITVGLREENFDNSLSIFPNPAKDKIHFQINNVNAEKCSLEIMNLAGEQVKLIQYGTNSFIKDKIDLSDLPKGVYFLKTSLGAKSQTQKLLVE